MKPLMHMLLVDDELAIRRDVSKMLRTEFPEHTVDVASSYEEALRVMRTRRTKKYVTRVVIVDEKLESRRRGSDLLLYLREHYPAVKTVMLAAHATRENLSRAINEGRLDRYILKKDFNSNHSILFDAIRELLSDGESLFYDAIMRFLEKAEKAGVAEDLVLVAAKEALSPGDLLREMMMGTTLGQEHVKEFADLMYNVFQDPKSALKALAVMAEARKKGGKSTSKRRTKRTRGGS
jgi:DNA-binding NarL/FixJ family response regulator